jgi:hypothetical protein
MTSRSRNHLTAWLGLVAMWLIVLAPIVSQWVAAAHRDDPNPVLCSATQPAADSAHVTHADPLAACGYCDLMANHTAIPAPPQSLLLFITVVAIAAIPTLSIRFTPLGAFPSGRPRAPPVLS